MSLEGNATGGQVLRGNVHRLDTLTISAYGIAVQNGFEGTEEEWLASLKGEKGETGEQGIQGIQGETGGKGEAGKSAYQYAVESGYEGTEEEFAIQLANGGGDEVVVSPIAPTDEKAKLWINPDEEDEEIVGIESVEATHNDSAKSTIVDIKMTDGSVCQFGVPDGKDGAKGDTGAPGQPGANGADGKSAYAYAKDGGYAGTEEDFAVKLAEESDSTLLVVTFTTDENGKHTPSHTYDEIKEWLNNGGSAVLTNGNQWYNLAFMNASTVWFERTVAMSTGTQYVRYVITAMGQMTKTEDTHKLVNVTAEVGQTIIVKEVDAKGKPTKWESADYQPRTHWTEEAVILEETTVVPDGDGNMFISPLSVPSVGDICKVTYNGTEYECKAVDGTAFIDMTSIVLGNVSLAMGTGDTGEPFILVIAVAGENGGQLMPMDGSETFVLSIESETVTKLPVKYIPDAVAAYAPHYIVCTRFDNDADGNTIYKAHDSVTTIESLIDAGRQVIAKIFTDANGTIYATLYHDFTGDDGKRILKFSAYNVSATFTPQDDDSYLFSIV